MLTKISKSTLTFGLSSSKMMPTDLYGFSISTNHILPASSENIQKSILNTKILMQEDMLTFSFQPIRLLDLGG